MTTTETVTLSELLSVTVMVADPAATPVTEMVLPLMVTVATAVLLDRTLYGFVPPVTAQVSVAPAERGRLVGLTLSEDATVTATVTLPEALSVTVMVADPAAMPLIERVFPLMETVATAVLLDRTLYGFVPPVTAQVSVAPAERDRLVGLTLSEDATVTATATLPEAPSVTVMVADPAAMPLIERVFPLMETVATAVLLDRTLYGVVPPLTAQVSVAPAERGRLVGLTLSEDATVTATATLPEAPSVTVMVADPAAMPLIERVFPLMETVATAVLLDRTLYGVVPPLTAQVSVAPAERGRLVGLTLSEDATVTATVTLPEALSVTVMVADPAATPVTERVLPLIETVATAVLLDRTLYGFVPPLTAQVSVAPAERDRLVGLTLSEDVTVTATVTLPESLSVTVMVADPAATPVTERVLPLIETVATAVLLDRTLYGVVPPLTAQVPVFPAGRDRLVGLTLSSGFTVTATVTLLESLSVTVMVADPAAMPLTERVLPLIETVATAVSLDAALYGVVPPLMAQVSVSPAERDRLVGLTLSAGVTVTATVTLLESPSLTVMVADPAETPVMRSAPSPIEAVATVISLEAAVYGRMPPLMAQVPVAPADRDNSVGLTLSEGATVTATVTLLASPSLMVMVAEPAETPVTEIVSPLRGETVATAVLLEAALYGRVPPLILQELVFPTERLRLEGTTDRE